MPFKHSVPRPFTAYAVRQYAPSVSGVYGLTDAVNWIYVGETDDIRESLMGHVRDTQRAPAGRKPTGFYFEECDRRMRASRQDRLVQEYEPFRNRHWSQHHD